MPTVAQILTNRDDDRLPARHLTGTVTAVSAARADITLTLGGASVPAAVPVDIPVAVGDVVLVLLTGSVSCILARLKGA